MARQGIEARSGYKRVVKTRVGGGKRFATKMRKGAAEGGYGAETAMKRARVVWSGTGMEGMEMRPGIHQTHKGGY